MILNEGDAPEGSGHALPVDHAGRHHVDELVASVKHDRQDATSVGQHQTVSRKHLKNLLIFFCTLVRLDLSRPMHWSKLRSRSVCLLPPRVSDLHRMRRPSAPASPSTSALRPTWHSWPRLLGAATIEALTYRNVWERQAADPGSCIHYICM